MGPHEKKRVLSFQSLMWLVPSLSQVAEIKEVNKIKVGVVQAKTVIYAAFCQLCVFCMKTAADDINNVRAILRLIHVIGCSDNH